MIRTMLSQFSLVWAKIRSKTPRTMPNVCQRTSPSSIRSCSIMTNESAKRGNSDRLRLSNALKLSQALLIASRAIWPCLDQDFGFPPFVITASLPNILISAFIDANCSDSAKASKFSRMCRSILPRWTGEMLSIADLEIAAFSRIRSRSPSGTVNEPGFKSPCLT